MLFKIVLTLAAIPAGSVAIYGAYAHEWQSVVAGALLFGAIALPLVYDKLIVKIVLKDGPEVTVDASRSEK